MSVTIKVRKKSLNGFIVSPDDIAAKIASVDSQMSNLHADYGNAAAAKKITADLYVAWKNFYESWIVFRDAHESWFSRLTAEPMDQAESFERYLIEWRTKLVSNNVTVNDPGAPDAKNPPKTTDIIGLIKWGVAAVIVVTVVPPIVSAVTAASKLAPKPSVAGRRRRRR